MFNLRITDEDTVAEEALARDFTRQSPFHYGLMIAASALGAFGGLILVAFGLVDIMSPILPLSMGLTVSGLGAVVVFGCLAILQVYLRRRKAWRLYQTRLDGVVKAEAADPDQ